MHQVVSLAWTHSGEQKTIKACDFNGLKREAERNEYIYMRFEKRDYVYADKGWHVVR